MTGNGSYLNMLEYAWPGPVLLGLAAWLLLLGRKAYKRIEAGFPLASCCSDGRGGGGGAAVAMPGRVPKRKTGVQFCQNGENPPKIRFEKIVKKKTSHIYA